MLRATASSSVRRGYSGVYHMAINLPDEAAFAQTLARLMSIGARVGTTDHVDAQSIYLGTRTVIGYDFLRSLLFAGIVRAEPASRRSTTEGAFPRGSSLLNRPAAAMVLRIGWIRREAYA